MHCGYGLQKQRYAMHQESSWQSKNEYQSNGGSASAMHIVPDLLYSNVDSAGHRKHHSNFEAQLQSNGRYGQNMHQNGWYGGGGGGSGSVVYHHQNHHSSSGGKKLPLMTNDFNGSNFSEAAMLNDALGNTGFVYEEVHGSSATTPARVRVQEMTYEHSSWGGDNGHNYCNDFDYGIYWKRNGFQKAPWISKGLWG